MGKPKKSDDYGDKSPATSNTLYSLRSRCIIKPPFVTNNSQKKRKEKEKENLFHPTSAPQPPQSSSQENSKPFPSSLFHPPPSPPSSPGLTWQPRSQEESEDIIRKQLAKFMSKFLTEDDDKINYMEWTSWANKALDYYNLKQGTKFNLVRVTGVVSNVSMPRRLVHIEFQAKSDDDDDDDLCKVFFSEMLVPWNNEEHETIVRGCCTMEKTDSGEDLNARACSHCGRFELWHPTPRYGFRSNSGDSFADLASYY